MLKKERKKNWVCALNSCGSLYSPVERTCEHSNENWSSINRKYFGSSRSIGFCLRLIGARPFERSVEAGRITKISSLLSLHVMHQPWLLRVFQGYCSTLTGSPVQHFTSLLVIQPTRWTNFSYLLWMKLYMFRTVPLSIIRSFSLYTQQWYMSYSFADSWRAGSGFHLDPARKLYDIYHYCVYSEKLLMMDRGTVRNMWSFIQNKFENLVHLFRFIIRICHDARSHERKILPVCWLKLVLVVVA